MKKLANKVAIITGGSGGIGLATARVFLEEGARVMLVDLYEKDLMEAVAQLNSKKVLYCAADVSKTEDVKRYVTETLSKFGSIDIFFNNAGIEGRTSPMATYPEAVYDQVMAVNVKGVWLGCQEVLPVMNPGGSVMITSSVAGLKGFANLGAYVASKHAVVGIMRVAALEFAEKGIRVNTIHPGPVNNRMMRAIEADMSPENPKEVQKGFEAVIPLKRYAENEEIAQLALFFASDDSRYITGTIQVIDGGMMLA